MTRAPRAKTAARARPTPAARLALAAVLLAAASGLARAEDATGAPPAEAPAKPAAQGGEPEPPEEPAEPAEPEEPAEPKEPSRAERGLFPFLPSWVPLGPPWVPKREDRRGPGHSPETMRPESPVGSTPDPSLPLEEKSDWSLIPIPIVYADPNLGFGIGLMPVLLLHPDDRIEWIIAPSVDYNDLLGVSFTSRVFYYPTLQEELFVYNDWSTEGKFEHEARFHGRDRFLKWSDFFARGYIVSDPTRRFFGLGSQTVEDDETDYEQNESAVESDIGYLVTEEIRLAGTFRWRHSRVKRGILDDLPDTVDVFPDLGGVRKDVASVLAFGARVTIDLRDDPTFPSKGLLIDAFGEVAVKGGVGNTSFWRWGGSVAGYLPLEVLGVPDALVTVARADYHALSGDDNVPFWELPTLGGRSRLRGFGVGRFTHDSYLLFTIEERMRVYELEVRDNRLRIELAAFLDVGRVFGENDGLSDKDWQYVPGGGARILLPDSGIIARGDIGFGGEGPAIFLVLGYPF